MIRIIGCEGAFMMSWDSIPWLPAGVMLIYMIARRQRFIKIVETVLKVLLGYGLMLIGSQIAQWAIKPLDNLMFHFFGIHGGILNTEVFGTALLNDYGSIGFSIMLLSFAISLIMAAWTKIKLIYMTAHHRLFLSLLVAMLFKTETDLDNIRIILFGTLLIIVYTTLTVFITQPFMQKLTGASNLAMGNSTSSASIIGGFIGKLFRHRIEKFDGEATKLKFGFTEISAASTILLFVVYLAFGIMGGNAIPAAIFESGQSWWTSALIRTISFGAALTILLKGISTFLSSIIEAFLWLYQRFASKAVIGIDASAVLPYSPKAWLAGFISSSIAGTITAIVILILKAGYVPLIGLTSFYFVGGVAGVFGNIYGGKRGAIVASVIVGFITVWVCSAFMMQLDTMKNIGVTFGETEYSILGYLLQLVLKVFKL